MTSWAFLFLSGICDIVWTIGLKFSDGFSKIMPSVITIFAGILSSYLLAIAMKDIPLSIAYIVWVGIGVIGAVVAGVFLFHEILTPAHIIFLTMIVVGIVGLKLVGV